MSKEGIQPADKPLLLIPPKPQTKSSHVDTSPPRLREWLCSLLHKWPASRPLLKLISKTRASGAIRFPGIPVYDGSCTSQQRTMIEVMTHFLLDKLGKLKDDTNNTLSHYSEWKYQRLPQNTVVELRTGEMGYVFFWWEDQSSVAVEILSPSSDGSVVRYVEWVPLHSIVRAEKQKDGKRFLFNPEIEGTVHPLQWKFTDLSDTIVRKITRVFEHIINKRVTTPTVTLEHIVSNEWRTYRERCWTELRSVMFVPPEKSASMYDVIGRLCLQKMILKREKNNYEFTPSLETQFHELRSTRNTELADSMAILFDIIVGNEPIHKSLPMARKLWHPAKRADADVWCVENVVSELECASIRFIYTTSETKKSGWKSFWSEHTLRIRAENILLSQDLCGTVRRGGRVTKCVVLSDSGKTDESGNHVLPINANPKCENAVCVFNIGESSMYLIDKSFQQVLVLIPGSLVLLPYTIVRTESFLLFATVPRSTNKQEISKVEVKSTNKQLACVYS